MTYRYFGAARDLPGVRDLFVQEAPTKAKRTRADMFTHITPDYYGFRDEDNEALLKAETKAEKLAIEESEREYKRLKLEKNEAEESSSDEEIIGDDEPLKSHIILPSEEEISKLIIEKRRAELLAQLNA